MMRNRKGMIKRNCSHCSLSGHSRELTLGGRNYKQANKLQVTLGELASCQVSLLVTPASHHSQEDPIMCKNYSFTFSLQKRHWNRGHCKGRTYNFSNSICNILSSKSIPQKEMIKLKSKVIALSYYVGNESTKNREIIIFLSKSDFLDTKRT